ncbi:MAG: hypothetical protein FJ286_08585 [Planctomycetes bacterium]|nr:hypothetical protein [Planctomycetota bacterium]
MTAARHEAAKTLDAKVARLRADPRCRDFIIADAKDADMAFGLAAPGPAVGGDRQRGPFRSLADFREQIREIVSQGFVDVMLMSASTSDVLAREERLFDGSPVTPAVRMNDTTDIWLAAGSGTYPRQPALPFSTASIPHAQWGRLEPPGRGRPVVDLGLFSITLNGDAAADRAMLTAYRDFRHEAERNGFRHFLEVFFPNALAEDGTAAPLGVARFVADHVVRALAGVPAAGRPVFLKIPYLGPEVTAQLAAYDPTLIIGILGGAAGTTHDAFALVAESKRSGARVALFGRKINAAEHQLEFVRHLRAVADEHLPAAEAVRSYHAAIGKHGLAPHRSLEDDLAITHTAAAYCG